jgi:hypothetical protein
MLLIPASTTFAQGIGVGATVKTDVSVSSETRGEQENYNFEEVEKDETSEKGEAQEAASAKGTLKAEAHRSAVATLVASLLADADRDGGIGAEVRAVAELQNESASSTAKAIAKIENRSKLTTFLIGSDWKTLGALRSNLAKTSADTLRLENALSKSTDARAQADLAVQLEALKEQNANLETFVEAHAKSFSLFGWFTKLFAGVSVNA